MQHRADSFVSLPAPQNVMMHMRDHFREHGTVSGSDGQWSVAFEIGSASARADDGGIAFAVTADDEASLALLQWSVAEHVHEFSGGARPDIAWIGGTAAGAQLPYFREMEVTGCVDVTPRMRRVTLRGPNLARFAEKGHHVRLMLPPAPGVMPVWPVMAADGRQAWPEGARPAMRVYTIRRIDVAAGEIDVDFVLHEGTDMPGARFAMTARPGDRIGLAGPGGATLPRSERYVFLGDETALPAIGRTLEALPAGAQACVFAEIHDRAEIQHLSSPAATDVHWLSREGRPAGTTTLLRDALQSHLPDHADAFIWAGCEHQAARDLRGHLRAVGVDKKHTLVAAYWRKGVSGADA